MGSYHNYFLVRSLHYRYCSGKTSSSSILGVFYLRILQLNSWLKSIYTVGEIFVREGCDFHFSLDFVAAVPLQIINMTVNMNQTAGASALPCEQPGQRFQLTLLTSRVKTCYGCKAKFTKFHRKAPRDLILMRPDNREFPDRQTRETRRSWKMESTHYHLNMDCVRKNYSMAQISGIVIHEEIKDKLSEAHLKYGRKFGLKFRA